MKRIRMVYILFGSVLAAFLVPLAARAWLASPRPVEAPAMDIRTWGPGQQQLSENEYTPDGMQFYPAVAVVSPTVYVAWSRQVGDNVEYYDPYYRSSSQNGDLGQWGGQVDIQPGLSTKETTRVDVAVDDSYKPHFVWSEYTRTPSYTLYYSYTNASTISPITSVEDDELLSPAIAVSDGDNQVHVVWSLGSGSIKYASKPIGSGSWSSINITSSILWPMQPDIAVTGAGVAHVVWSEGNPGSADIFYANSSDGFTIRKVYDGIGRDGRSPAIAVSGDNVYVVWAEWINRENQYISFRQSTNGGSNWGPLLPISGRFAANEESPWWLRPAIAVDSNEKIHVAFNGAGATGDPEDIWYASKTQIGIWLPCRNLTYNVDGNNTTPDLAASGEDVHLVWAGPPGPFDPEGNEYEVLYKRTITLGEGGLYLPIILKSY